MGRNLRKFWLGRVLSSSHPRPMRTLILVTGQDSVSETIDLSTEIRRFNAEIDFRLRFLDIEIEEFFAAPPASAGILSERLGSAEILALDADDSPRAAAELALTLDRQRPNLLVLVGAGPLLEPGIAAARAAESRFAHFGEPRATTDGALDLGADASGALERLTGVAREIR